MQQHKGWNKTFYMGSYGKPLKSSQGWQCFTRTGLFPWNKQALDQLKQMPRTVFKRTEHSEQLDDLLLAE